MHHTPCDRPSRIGTLFFLATLAASPAVGQGLAEFHATGSLPGNVGSNAWAVSADGATLVGSLSAGGDTTTAAYAWTLAGGVVALADLAGGPNWSEGWGVNADGTVVVGSSLSGAGKEACRWVGGAIESLGDLPGGGVEAEARDVAADGSVVVGFGSGASGREAFRWDPIDGMVGLGDLAGGAFDSQAYGITADGTMIVGAGATSSGMRACRWVSGGAPEILPGQLGGLAESIAFDVSDDGSTVVGWVIHPTYNQGFRWRAETGMVGLGWVSGSSFAGSAQAVNADGSIVVGGNVDLTPGGAGLIATIWDEAHGIRDLKQVLESDYGLDLSGWQLSVATDISPDGRVIVGYGQDPAGVLTGWWVRLPEPCPADFDGNGLVELADLEAFTAAFQAGDPSADFNGDGQVDLGDVADFTAAYQAGCEPYPCVAATNYCTATPTSLGVPATISMTGSVKLSQNDLVLEAGPCPAGQFGIFYYGPNEVGFPFGNGFRCVGGGSIGVFRLPIGTVQPDGRLVRALDVTALPGPQGGFAPGDVWKFQAWFRDPAAGGANFDLSDGLSVRFCP